MQRSTAQHFWEWQLGNLILRIRMFLGFLAVFTMRKFLVVDMQLFSLLGWSIVLVHLSLHPSINFFLIANASRKSKDNLYNWPTCVSKRHLRPS